MLRRHSFRVLGLRGLVAIASLVSGIPEPPPGKREASYYFWDPGQAVSLLIHPADRRGRTPEQLRARPAAFFVNVPLYASIGMGVVSGVAEDDGGAGKLGGGEAEEQDGR